MDISPRGISEVLVKAYSRAGFFTRLLIRFRPYICPFHGLVPFVPENGVVLEVGCGAGMMTVLLANLGRIKKAVGFDVSQKAVDTAKKAAPGGCELSFRRLAAGERWPQDGFDTVVCIDVLHHVPRREQRTFIKNLSGIRPGRRIIFKDVSPKPFWMALGSVLHDLLLSRQWIYIRSEDDVEAWFMDEGMEIRERKRLDTLWYSHYLIVAERKDSGAKCR